MFSCVPLLKVPCLAPRPRGAGLVLASDCQRTCALPLASSVTPRFFGKAGAKVQPFSEPASVFFKYFSFLSQMAGSQPENFSSGDEIRGSLHLVLIRKGPERAAGRPSPMSAGPARPTRTSVGKTISLVQNISPTPYRRLNLRFRGLFGIFP